MGALDSLITPPPAAPAPMLDRLLGAFGFARDVGSLAMGQAADNTNVPGVSSTLNHAAGAGAAALDIPMIPTRMMDDARHYAATGEYTPEMAGDAVQAVTTLGAGGMGMAEPGAAGVFGGRLSQTANHTVADLTEQALAKGATDRQVLDAGGWFPGVDSKLRYEIPDHAATYTGQGATVGEAIDHPALFAAYPDLAKAPFSTADLGPGSFGHFDGDGIVLNSSLPPGQARSVLLHELQHRVQQTEDFARGGNANYDHNYFGGANADERMSAYRGLAGEVEARNVQARGDMTPDQLAARPPWETQDTPYINQNPHSTVTNGATTSAEPPRLLNGELMTAEQHRLWLYGGMGPGASRVPGVEGTGFYYHDFPNVMANEMPHAAAASYDIPQVPAGTQGMFGGRLAKTADEDLHDIALAQYALRNQVGYTPESILKSTGWYKGVDGEMRFEIPDNAAALKAGVLPEDGTHRLGDVFDHPALFEAYPHLADANVEFAPIEGRGTYSPETGSMAINNSLSPSDATSTMLHELQHGVQAHEGFVTGADSSMLHDGFDAYHHTAGEVEARNVQARQTMDGADRLSVPPWKTQDVLDQYQHLAPREYNEPQADFAMRQPTPFYREPLPRDEDFIGRLMKQLGQ